VQASVAEVFEEREREWAEAGNANDNAPGMAVRRERIRAICGDAFGGLASLQNLARLYIGNSIGGIPSTKQWQGDKWIKPSLDRAFAPQLEPWPPYSD